MIGRTISHYKILEKIGEGGMGVVYKAADTTLKRTVALKFLSQNVLENESVKNRFVREAQAAAGLDHTNICTVHEISEADGHTFIVMAYVEGHSLRELLTEQEPLPLDEAIDIATQVARGLAKAHRKGVIHRDVKPANIRITPEHEVKIVDFGLAKAAAQTRLTRTGTTVGTVAYMSPEQAQGEEVDHRSDVFSLGVVLYEMLSGRFPFKGEQEAALLYGIVNTDPEPLESTRGDLPEGLVQIVAKALSKDVHERYQSAADMADDLERLVRGDSPLLRTRRKRLFRVTVPAVVVVLAAVLVVLKFAGIGGPGVVAAENKLAIMVFENVSDPDDSERLGDIVSNLLITGLSESEHMSVVSNERVYDLLNKRGKADEKVIDGTTASEVATEAEARWFLTGSILQTDPYVVLTSQVVDVAKGDVTASQRVNGAPGELIFSLVDRLTRDIKSDLAIPAGSEEEGLPSVADVTTHSIEAYRLYVEGMDYLNRGFGPEAKASFDKALAYDSTFAMTHMRIATSHIIGIDQKERLSLLNTAERHAEKAGKKDRMYIASAKARYEGRLPEAIEGYEEIVKLYPDEKEAHFQLGWLYSDRRELERAIASYETAIDLDPLAWNTYQHLYFVYQDLGDIGKATWAIERAMTSLPDHHDPYSTLGWQHANSGRLDEAIESFRQALLRNPNYAESWFGMASVHLVKRDYEVAREYSQKMLASTVPWERGVGFLFMAYISFFQGKLEEGLKTLDAGIAHDDMAGERGDQYCNKIYLRSLVHFEKGDRELAVADANLFLQASEEASVENWSFPDRALISARAGRFEKADEILNDFMGRIDTSSRSQMFWYRVVKGLVEVERGELDTACEHLGKAVTDSRWGIGSWIPNYFFALAHFKAGRFGRAAEEFEKAANIVGIYRIMLPFEAVRMYFYLGLAYEQTGEAEKAAQQYQVFLDYWGDGDPGIDEVADAKQRLAALQADM